jgi:aminopeptidase YwaD
VAGQVRAAPVTHHGAPTLKTGPHRLLAGALLATLLLVACSGGGAATPTPSATPAPTPTATPVDLGPPEPQIDRILDHIEALSIDIGARPAGSAEEERAAEYAREQFEAWGYDVELQPFPVQHDMLREASVTADGREIEAASFVQGAAGTVTAPLVDAGRGHVGDFPPEASGAIVLIQREDVTHSDMARRAEAAGAAGVIVANREAGRFFGFVDPPTALPMANIDQAEGESLRAALAQGPVEVTVTVQPARELTSRNVLARPPGEACRTLSGGHYDSVPWAAGAIDNASGAATVLELARAAASSGLSGHCFALFGAEEIGLLGSGHLVSQLSEADRAALTAMYNYDVTSGGDAVELIGSDPLIELALIAANARGVPAQRAELPEGANSDHASFIEAGIPALLFTSNDFAPIHTEADNFANLEPGALDATARLGFALLQDPETP